MQGGDVLIVDPRECDTLAGSYIFPGILFPTVFGTSCLDMWAKER